MPVNPSSYDRLKDAIWSATERQAFEPQLTLEEDLLLFSSPADVAAFVLVSGDADATYENSYEHFRGLYRRNRASWNKLTLSFVLCRTEHAPSQDAFFSCLEIDPYFCRKYVIHPGGAGAAPAGVVAATVSPPSRSRQHNSCSSDSGRITPAGGWYLCGPDTATETQFPTSHRRRAAEKRCTGHNT